jgi:amino acid transporter
MNIKNTLFGHPLKSNAIEGERLPIWKALPILSSDAISSVAYGTEEILVVFASAGLLVGSYVYSLFVAFAIILMIAIVITSYRQVIDAYPQGGGAYKVTRDWFGPMWGRITASSLLIDYTLTVAVSISAGVTAITSAFPVAHPLYNRDCDTYQHCDGMD